MGIEVRPSGQACGAAVIGVDLSGPLDDAAIAEIRSAWLEHHVLAFPGQSMTDDDLERFTLYFGPFGDDPFIAPIEGRQHVIAIKRDADETSPLFAENWHTDWSFQARPPAGTCLYGITIPRRGGIRLRLQVVEIARCCLALRWPSGHRSSSGRRTPLRVGWGLARRDGAADREGPYEGTAAELKPKAPEDCPA